LSGPLELFRTTVNVRGLGVGTQIEIDPTDEAWAGDIRSKRIVPVERDGPAPDEWVEDWDTGAIVDLGDDVTHGLPAQAILPGRGAPRGGLIDRAVSETYLTDDDDDR
jgi:hypothetical protein